MVVSLVSFVIAFAFIAPREGSDPTPTWAWLVVVGATGLGIFEIRSTERRMDLATDDTMAAEGYTVVYFLRMGFGMTPALFGFALFFVSGARALYLVAVVLSEILLWLIAPSRRNLQRRTERFRTIGRDIDMTRALMAGDLPGTLRSRLRRARWTARPRAAAGHAIAW